MKQTFPFSFVLVAVLSLGAAGLMGGCSDQGSNTATTTDELEDYLAEHPEAMEEARKMEEQMAPGYVAPDEEALSQQE